MSVLNKDEMMSKLKALIGDKSDDETLSFLEDINDTFDSKEKDNEEDWKKKYEDNDKAWREKYRDRFFNQTKNSEEEDEEDKEQEKSLEEDKKEAEKLTFEGLFKEE